MLSLSLIPLLTCSALINFAADVSLNTEPVVKTDPNIALVKSEIDVSNYYDFQPSEEYLQMYNQTLTVVGEGDREEFEKIVGKRCRKGLYLLGTYSFYERKYVDNHDDMVDVYVLAGRMNFLKFDCVGFPYYQIRDAHIYPKCKKTHTLLLEPCMHMFHDANFGHSVEIKELEMIRFLCFN